MPISVILAVFLVAVGYACWSYYFSPEQRLARAIRAAPCVTIGDATEGKVVRLVGRVEYLKPPLEAPMSGRKCAFYQATVEEYRRQGKSGYWKEIIRDEEGVDFLLDDGTGRARIVARMLKVYAIKDKEYESGMFQSPTPALNALLEKHGQSTTAWWIFKKSLRYREAVFEQGERVAVVGQVFFEEDPASESLGQYRVGPPKRVVLKEPPLGFLLASDVPGVVRS